MNENVKIFQELLIELEGRADIVIAKDRVLNATLIFQDHLCDISTFNRDLLPHLFSRKEEWVEHVFPGLVRPIQSKTLPLKEQIYQIMFQGLLVYYDERRSLFFLVDLSQAIRRSTSDSLAEPPNMMGARDGFTESYKDNLSLIRMRLKSSNLSIDQFSIGRRSKTWVGLLSIDDIHNQEHRAQLNEKLSAIDIDAVLGFQDLIPYLNDRIIFPFYDYIGMPDMTSLKLLSGQFILVIDRIPVVVGLPSSFGLMTKVMSYENIESSYGFFQKMFLFLALFLSTIGLGILLSVVTYQADSLSLTVLSSLKVTQKGAIFPIWLEVIMIVLLFEVYYVIGFRSSQTTVSNMIMLVGGLIIGQNAIESGLVGVIVMTITALSFLCTFVVTNNIVLIRAISFMRIVFILAALFMGLFGVTLAFIVFLLYFSKQSFLDLHFFHPFIPLHVEDAKFFLFTRSFPKVTKRVESLELTDITMKSEEGSEEK